MIKKVSIVLMLLFVCTYTPAAQNIDSLLQEVTNEKSAGAQFKLWIQIGTIYMRTRNIEALDKVAQQMLQIALKSQSDSLTAIAYTVLGTISEDKADFNNALAYEFKALKLFEKLKDNFKICYISEQIGVVFKQLLNVKETLKYLNKAQQFLRFPEIKNTWMPRAIYANKAEIFLFNNQIDSALYYIQKANEVVDKENDLFGYSRILLDFGKIYQTLDSFSLADVYLKKAIVASKKAEEPVNLVESLLEYSRLKLKQNDYLKAKTFALNSLHERKNLTNQSGTLSIEITKTLSQIYSKLKLYDSAYYYSNLNNNFRDSVFNTQTLNSIGDLTFNENILAIELEQKKKEAIAQKELQQQKLVRNGFIGGFGVVLLFAGVFFRQRNKIKKGNDELQVAKKRAELSEQYKQQFLANMSHEIRTPMNAVMGMTNLLINKNPRIDQLAYLNGIKNSSDNLLYIINDILDLSKIESGKIELEQIDFSLRDVLDQVKQTLNHKAEEKGLELILYIDKNIPEVVVGDPVRLSQVLINLAGNAIKFTDKGSVVVSVGNDISSMKFSIIDTGIGIPKDKLQSVFESFRQAHSSDTRKYGGTGLGLSISKQFVELMGGKITIESEVGSGTTFSFIINLPVGSVDNIQAQKSTNQIDGSILNGLRILLSDDNEYNRTVARDSLLSISNVYIEEATNGKEVIDLLNNEDFDVILMDVQMPIMDGYEATRYIREKLDPPKNNVPIIALTASVIKSDLDKCREAGMNDYVAKPFIVSQLVLAIAKTTRREVKFKKEKETKLIPGNRNNVITDLTYLEKFCEGDKVRMQKYINLFIFSAPQVIEKIQAAIDNDDLTEIVSQVHGFKTKLIMMGMNEAKELAVSIETAGRSENPHFSFISLNSSQFISQIRQAIKELNQTID